MLPTPIQDLIDGYRTRLVLFMTAKQNLLHDAGIRKPLYFTIKDARAINSWPWLKSVTTWLKLCNNIKRKGYTGLSPGLCPFCLRHKNNCDVCEYGKHHNKCSYYMYNEDGVVSDYFCITQQLQCVPVAVFDSAFYKSVIKNISKRRLPLYNKNGRVLLT